MVLTWDNDEIWDSPLHEWDGAGHIGGDFNLLELLRTPRPRLTDCDEVNRLL